MSLWRKTLAKFHNLRMRNQIFLIEFFAFLISFILIASFYRIQQNVIIGIYENSSTIVLSKQDRIALNLFLPQLNYYIIAKQHQRIQLLSSLGTIYSNLNSYFVNENFQNALPCQPKGQQDFLFQLPELCYSCNVCPNGNYIPSGDKFSSLIKFSRIVTEFILLFDTMQHNRIFYVSTGQPSFGCIYPQAVYDQEFNPQVKDWFQNHLKSYQVNSTQKYYFSQLYFSGTQFIYKLTISYSLQNSNDSSLDAIAGTDIDAEDENMKQVQANTYLINQYGQIIYRNVNLIMNQKELNFIYQENKTGFNLTDWQEISNLAQGSQSTSNCLMEQTRILCRYNSIYKQPIKIVAKEIPGNFILMMFTNSSFEQELKDSFKNIEKKTTSLQESGFYQQLGNSVIIISITMIVVILMFRPITRVMKAAKIYIRSMGNNLDKEIFKLTKQNHKRKGLFSKLELQILNFGDVIERSQQQKGVQCKTIESFQYLKQGLIREKVELLSEINKNHLEKKINYSQKQLTEMITKSLKLLNKNHHQIQQH